MTQERSLNERQLAWQRVVTGKPNSTERSPHNRARIALKVFHTAVAASNAAQDGLVTNSTPETRAAALALEAVRYEAFRRYVLACE